MTPYLVAIHHPDGYDGSLEGEEMIISTYKPNGPLRTGTMGA